MIAALSALVDGIEQRLQKRGVSAPPDAFVLGAQRVLLVEALQRGLLAYVAAIHWPTFQRLAPRLCARGLDGLLTTVALSLPEALASGAAAEVLESLSRGAAVRPPSVLFRRLTHSTAGHILFRSQLLRLADGEFGTTPLEMGSLLQRHTPAAIAAMLHARLIKGRPDLDGTERQALVAHATRHLGRLLPESAAARSTTLLLRLAYYRLHHEVVARQVLRRLRIVDFSARRTAADGQARPSG